MHIVISHSTNVRIGTSGSRQQ